MLHLHCPLSKECFISIFWATHCKVGSIINSNVCHIFTRLALCSMFLVYWRNNYYRSLENPFIIQFYFLNTVSEGRVVHILNGECKGVYLYYLLPFMWAIHSILYYLALSSGCFYLSHHPHIQCPYLWTFHLFVFILTLLHILGLYTCIKFMFCCQESFLSLWCCTWLDTPVAFWVPTGKRKMKVRRTVLTALIWGPGGVVTLCGCITLCWLWLINLKSHVAMGIL